MKYTFAAFIVFLLISPLGNSAFAAGEPVNAMCPVTTDEPADPYVTTEYEGETIGFCCKSCLRKFNANPDAYLSALGMNRVGTEQGENPSSVLEPANGQATNHTHTETVGEFAGPESKEAGGNRDYDHDAEYEAVNGTPLERLATYLGKFHVLVVHLPIALLPLAAVFELWGGFRQKERWLRVARVNFVMGALFALVAASLGWLAVMSASYPGELADYLEWHRWFGTSVAGLSVVGLLSLLLVRFDCEWGTLFYRICVYTLGVLVPVTAHFGGSLIYGPDYLF